MKRFLTAPMALKAATLALLPLFVAPVAFAADSAVSPPPGEAPVATPVVRQYTLSNGMTLIVRPDHRAPTVAHMLWVRVGSMDEVDGTSGVAHVLEHMLFKGTPDMPPGEFSRRVAALGGRENAFTSRDATAYHQQIPAQHLEAMMRLEADRFARNQWADEEFVRELAVVKEERRQRTEESPRALMFEAFNAMVFQASPYRRPIVGWMSDLDAMKPDDARAFYRQWYTPANAAVVIAGDVDADRVHALAESIYGRIPARALPERKPREEPLQTGPRRMEYRAVADQALLTKAWKVPRWSGAGGEDDRDALALTVLAAVLDGYSGARLERALVQGEGTRGRRVADNASASYGLMGRGPQLFMLSAVPAKDVAPDTVATALRAEVERIARDGVSEAELRRVKTQWTAGEIYKLDSVMSQARELGSYWVNGMPVDAGDRLMRQLQGVTTEQVQSVARRYFGDEQLNTGVLVPKADQRPADAPASGAANPPALRH
jgi:zinc protease